MWATLCPDCGFLPLFCWISWLDGEVDQFIVLTEKYSLLFFWPSVTTDSQFAGSEEVGMGSDKTGKEICESGNETLGSSLQSRGINVKLRTIVWAKLAKSNSYLAYSGTKKVLKLLLTEQSEGTKSARIMSVKIIWMLSQPMCFVSCPYVFKE